MLPNNLGKIFLTDECDRIAISDFVKITRKWLKEEILKSKLAVNNLPIELAKSHTGYGGERFWWICPMCGRRCGILYRHPIDQQIACRKCLRLKYRSNAKKGMIENQFR